MATTETTTVQDDVKEYYGKVLKTSSDLQTDACCPVMPQKMPAHVREALGAVHEVVKSKYYGCGLVIPSGLEDAKILDLGSGAGMDCFALSKLVGEKGHVTGIDMTDEQLQVANDYIQYHTEKFEYGKPNVNFVKGYIEKLSEAGIAENYYDIVVSNCVVNLSPDKNAVLSEAYKALKDGGEMYFSDVYSNKDLPEDVRKHKVLWGECVAGALNWKELYKIAKEVGFSTPRLAHATIFGIYKEEHKQVLGDAKFVSATYRLFKIPATAKADNTPKQVLYEGTILGQEDKFELDHQNGFDKEATISVSAEVYHILKASRFCDDFSFPPSGTKTCCSVSDNPEVDPFDVADGNVSAGCCATTSCCS